MSLKLFLAAACVITAFVSVSLLKGRNATVRRIGSNELED